MNDSEKIKTLPSRRERYIWILAIVWTMVAVISLVWGIATERQGTFERARIQAQIAYKKDLIYRRWNADHGGVYVPVSEETHPNPYLSHISERDITTPSGKLLTLMNPAYMIRQVHKLLQEEFSILGHLTSLNPIRPENVPDPWEAEALHAFDRGQTEIGSVEQIKGRDYFRLMRPLITEKSCLQCHASQGYKEGDIRGGLSVSIPMEPLRAVTRTDMQALGLGHVILWVMGLVGIVLGRQRIRLEESKRRLVEEALQKAHDELKDKVRERTAKLSQSNIQLKKEITERKRTEETLRRSQQNYEDLVNTIDGIVWEADARTIRFSFVSEQADRLLGYATDRWLTEPTFWKDHIHPDDREWAVAFCAKATAEKRDHEFEYRMIDTNGRTVWLRDIVNVVMENNQPVKLRGIMIDVTQHKQMEETIKESERSLTEAQRIAHLGNWDLDLVNNELRWSDEIYRIFGLKPQQFDATYEAFLDRVHPDDREFVDASYTNSVRNNTPYDIIHRIVRPDGEIRYVHEKAEDIKDKTGKTIRLIGTVIDITELKQAEKDLEASRDQLRRLSTHLQSVKEEERTHIAREIHDELGQALTALEMDIAWINKKLPEDQKQLIEKTRSMLQLTDTTIQSVQKISAELRPVVLDDLGLTAAIKWQANEFENRSGIECEVTIDPEDIVLEKDCSTAIFRIFQETLTNVARHAEATKVKVTMNVEDDLLVLNVTDNGKGITKEQISSNRSLGLIGMRERLYPWNGEFEIQGQKDKSTTVRVCVPLSSRR